MSISWPDLLNDGRLAAGLQREDNVSFEQLFHRHYDRVYGILFRLMGNRTEAEDLTQEVFLKLYRRPPQTAAADTNVGAWLYRVATNAGYNAIRGRHRRWERNRVLVPPESDPSTNPAREVEQAETAAAVRDALAQLAPRQAQLLILRQMGLSYAELAAACDVNENSVGKMLSRAADAFRAIYETDRITASAGENDDPRR